MMLTPQKSKRPGRSEISSARTLVAPLKGWNARDPEAAMAPGYALYLDNWFPDSTEVNIRKGAIDHATGLGTTPVKHIMAWASRTGTNKLFGCTDSGIYDVTAAGAIGASVSALTSGQCLSVNFGTTGGSYLFVVNGVDSIRYYDGAAWTVTATYVLGGGTINTNLFTNINVFKRSLFFLRKDSMNFYYFPIDTIAGTVKEFPLGALFSQGGYLMAMGTWTIDGGQGIDDYAAFVTSKGQIAIYKGTDPDSASTWALQGVYDLGAPLGRKCFLKFGGDLLYISKDGVYPLSKALQSTNTDTTTAVTDLISKAFSQAAKAWGGNWGWQGITSRADSLLLFNIPSTEFSISSQYVMNSKTGAWCRVTDWNAFCWELIGDQLYMGMAGKVARAWTGLNDFNLPINAYAKAAFDYLGVRTREKHVNLVRPVLKIAGSVSVSVAVDMDFNSGLSYGPVVFNPAVGSLWNVDNWDVAMWSAGPATRLDWVTVAVSDGYAAAVRLRVASKDATVGWSATDLAYETGGIKG